jgi:hypothetical protein
MIVLIFIVIAIVITLGVTISAIGFEDPWKKKKK